PPPLTWLYPLSLHDALPIYVSSVTHANLVKAEHQATRAQLPQAPGLLLATFPHRHLKNGPFLLQNARQSTSCARSSVGQSIGFLDRKSTRLNSSHDQISYAV